MRFKLLIAAILAALLAMPLGAADRPVGAEPAQQLGNGGENDFGHPSDPDESSDFVRFPRYEGWAHAGSATDQELGLIWYTFWCRTFRWFAGDSTHSKMC